VTMTVCVDLGHDEMKQSWIPFRIALVGVMHGGEKEKVTDCLSLIRCISHSMSFY